MHLLTDNLRKLWGLILNMDSRLIRAVWVTLLVLGVTAVVLLIGKSAWAQEALHGMEGWMAGYARSPWAVLVVIFVFCASALMGAPQFVLIAACVVVFGPWLGFAYSWVATVVSAIMTFYIGWFSGAGLLRKLGGERLARLSDYLGRNAFSASFIVRNIPSAPFIVVNMAFGASRANFMGFILGCALGSIPKTALVAILGGSLAAFRGEDGWKTGLLLAILAIIWLGLMLLARRFYERGRDSGRSS